jgi:hypothetical protein
MNIYTIQSYNSLHDTDELNTACNNILQKWHDVYYKDIIDLNYFFDYKNLACMSHLNNLILSITIEVNTLKRFFRYLSYNCENEDKELAEQYLNINTKIGNVYDIIIEGYEKYSKKEIGRNILDDFSRDIIINGHVIQNIYRRFTEGVELIFSLVDDVKYYIKNKNRIHGTLYS